MITTINKKTQSRRTEDFRQKLKAVIATSSNNNICINSGAFAPRLREVGSVNYTGNTHEYVRYTKRTLKYVRISLLG